MFVNEKMLLLYCTLYSVHTYTVTVALQIILLFIYYY